MSSILDLFLINDFPVIFVFPSQKMSKTKEQDEDQMRLMGRLILPKEMTENSEEEYQSYLRGNID